MIYLQKRVIDQNGRSPSSAEKAKNRCGMTVVKQVEVPVEKRVEVPVEKIVEKEVIPEGCSQMRRNGKIYINCDGQKVEGVPTLGEEGLQKAPELLQ